MKKIPTIFGVILFASILLTSCGENSIESDAKKLANLKCKAMELLQKAETGDQSVIEESSKLGIEADKLAKEIESKYSSKTDRKSFDDAFREAQRDCK